MMQLRDSTMLRIRGSWAFGADFLRGDIVARGSRNYMARLQHIAGTESEPLIGARWLDFWEIWPGESVLTGRELAPAPTPPAPRGEVVRLAPVIAPTEPAAPEPPEPPGTDLELATRLEIDSIRTQMRSFARTDWVNGQLQRIEQLLRGLAERVRAGKEAVFDSPVRAEMWRRIGIVVSSADRAEAELLVTRMMRERIRLLAKRDKGLSWTPEEAARAGVLDFIDTQIARLEERAELLEAHAIDDPADDKHWPKLAGAP